uniref:Uncharacterized protein n=1 Tax=Rhizophora mucronata TaxID=61149 RepID=A0A2P2K2C2_RHIMU
MAAPDLCILCN